ncbi:Uncharacterised protein [Starkeya nomas]|uniref:Methyltransferase n=1 Tax=Starkeya nomas TaxID=2666134 RepID=A0A5S9Q3W5_9HYPH|nr:DNA modification methylase [Starkeya nomas]CAA0112371.1 Uncharacterised protein [Starkeya nomas]
MQRITVRRCSTELKSSVGAKQDYANSVSESALSVASAHLQIVYKNIADIKPSPRRVRRAKKGQVEIVASRLRRFGLWYPILATKDGEIVDGHVIYDACRALGLAEIPVIVVTGLSDVEVRALRIWINKSHEGSTWDPDTIKAELEAILAGMPDLTALTGFSGPEIDAILRKPLPIDSAEVVDPRTDKPITQLGDVWLFVRGHKILCGNARDAASYVALRLRELVRMALSDIPYGVIKILGHVSRTHGEFLEGSGLTYDEALIFFGEFLTAMSTILADGAIVDLFIDAHGMRPLLNALQESRYDLKTLCVWDKLAGGMGSLYRQQTEFIVVSKWGQGAHTNNVSLGKYGRNRTTLWTYPGLAQQQAGRAELLSLHPTVKPIALLSEAILDTSNRGEIILDPFAGSGSLMLAADRVGRVAACIELDPKYVDVAVRRMEAETGEPARLEATGQTFAEVAQQRAASLVADPA